MASQRAGPEPLQRNEIEAFAADWYRKPDERVPAAKIAPLVLDRGSQFVVPEAIPRCCRPFGHRYARGGAHPGVIVCSLNKAQKAQAASHQKPDRRRRSPADRFPRPSPARST
jgi:hypothetical protein